MGWTRSHAVEWMTEHTPLPPIEVEAEVDRYISYPGQALSYMVGRLGLDRLRPPPPPRSATGSTSGSSTT